MTPLPNHDDLDDMARRVDQGLHAVAHTHRCCSGTLVGISEDGETLILAPATCRRWDCVDCASAKAALIYARVRAAHPERHITLTCNPKLHDDPTAALDAMKDSVRKLADRIRRGRPKTSSYGYQPKRVFEYACIWELTENGWPHAHLAQWGDFVPKHYLKALWKQLTGAYVTDVRQLDYSRQETHSWTKYLVKAIHRNHSLYWGRRLVSYSAAFDRHAWRDNARGDLGSVKWHKVIAMPMTVAVRLIEDLGLQPELLEDDRLAWDISPQAQPYSADELIRVIGHLEDWHDGPAFGDPPVAAPPQAEPQPCLVQGRLI